MFNWITTSIILAHLMSVPIACAITRARRALYAFDGNREPATYAWSTHPRLFRAWLSSRQQEQEYWYVRWPRHGGRWRAQTTEGVCQL